MNSLELTNIRAPSSGLIVRRYANPGSGASTLNVSTMFELQPDAPHIVRAQISGATVAAIRVGQPVEIVPESDSSKVYPGRVLRLGAVFGARTLQSDDPYERNDERVLEVVVSAPEGPLLIGQRVMVRFLPKT
jgi:HlyD family secretion protein